MAKTFRTFFEHAVATSTSSDKISSKMKTRQRTVRRTVQKKSKVNLAVLLSLSLTLLQSVSGLAVERKIDDNDYLLLSGTLSTNIILFWVKYFYQNLPGKGLSYLVANINLGQLAETRFFIF